MGIGGFNSGYFLRGRNGSGSWISGGFGHQAVERTLESTFQSPDEDHHFPTVRNLPVGWHHTATGTWTFDLFDEQRWEVVCVACGDTEGPADSQDEAVRRLRGPYGSKREAKRAARAHTEGPRRRPDLHWR